MRKIIGIGFVVSCLILSSAVVSFGASPSVKQMVAFEPVQDGVSYDTPSQETWPNCTLEVLKEPYGGWILYDANGLTLRRFLDTDGNDVVDRWCYFEAGQEVYRDIDSDSNGKADQCRWYHSGGSRWGEDTNHDGKLDRWLAISAEEATQEALAALATRDFDRLRRVLLDDADIGTLGIEGATADRVRKALGEAKKKFQKLTEQVSSRIAWSHFDGRRPIAVPGTDVQSSKDLVLYQNATIFAETERRTKLFSVAELVQVGQTWKLTDVPMVLDPDHPIVSASASVILASPVASGMVRSVRSAVPMELDVPEAAEEYLEALEEHDTKNMPTDSEPDSKAIIAYHVKRADLCAHIGSKCRKLELREYWYQQTADSLSAAIQTNSYPQGVRVLSQYGQQFGKTSWGKNLAAYFEFRAINSSYTIELLKENADHGKVQENYLTNLEKFIKTYPESNDVPEALWQLGGGQEFTGQTQKAITYYQQLAERFPETTVAQKAEGALRRLRNVGGSFELEGQSLIGSSRVQTKDHRGKVLLISYWATWCEPCKKEMPRLKNLRKKYHRQGLEIIGVCLDSEKSLGRNYVRQHDYDWPQIFEEGSMDSAPAVRYGVISLPYMVLVGPDGRVIDSNLQSAELETQVQKVMTRKIAIRKQ